MTIDEAIKYADMLSCNVNAFEVSKQFGAMCADALRLAKKMSEDAGISATPAQDTWQERRKRESHDDGLVVFDATVDDLQSLGALCAGALRLAKRMSDKPKGEPAAPDAKAAKTTKVDMNANEYQHKAMRTATHKCYDLANAALGLTGEAGEVADIIKKHLYQGHDLYPSEVIEELGDVLWYVALMADYFNVTLGFVMQQNITKLKARYPEGFDPVKSVNREEKKE